MAARIVQAAKETGLGLTLLPVLYEQGGCDGRKLAGGQLRFGNDFKSYSDILEASSEHVKVLPDGRTGVAPHSLRAVSRGSLAQVAGLTSGPVHLHIAEQMAEVTEVQAAYGARPVDWALANLPLDGRWCMIHATQMTAGETAALAATGAVAGLCPITEANLGDGIFDGTGWRAAGGVWGVGSDSNVRISLREELQLLEYSQRLRDRARAVLADARSTGRVLIEEAARGGAQAAGRDAGRIAPGAWADLTLLDTRSLALEGLQGDAVLDAFVFAGDDGLVTDLWSAGRHIVQEGRHIARDAVAARFRKVLQRLRGAL